MDIHDDTRPEPESSEVRTTDRIWDELLSEGGGMGCYPRYVGIGADMSMVIECDCGVVTSGNTMCGTIEAYVDHRG